MSYAVRSLFGNVPRLLSGAILLAVAALCVTASAAAQNATIPGSVPRGAASNEVMRVT